MKNNLAMHRNVFYLCLLIFFCSCDLVQNKKLNIKQIVINTNKVDERSDISSLIESIDIVELDENSDCFIGQAHKMIRTFDHTIILDKNIAKKIVVFDNQGKFLKNVITLGKGPGEAIQLNDIWLNSIGNLEIYDFAQKKIFTCNENFDIITETRGANYIFSALTRLPTNNNFVGFKNYSAFNPPHKGEYYQVAFLNSSLRQIMAVDHIYDIDLNNMVVLEPLNPFQNVNDTLRFSMCFNQFIYDILPEGRCVKKYQLVYSPNPFPLDYEKKVLMQHRKQLSANADFYETKNFTKGFSGYAGNWLEINNYALFASFNTNYERIYSVYSKKNESVVVTAKYLTAEIFNFKCFPDFKTALLQENSYSTMICGSMLHYFLSENHPMMAKQNHIIDKNYVITVKFKDEK